MQLLLKFAIKNIKFNVNYCKKIVNNNCIIYVFDIKLP